MQGVEILSIFETAIEFGWCWWMFGIFLVLTAIFCFFLYAANDLESVFYTAILGLLVSIFVSSPVTGINPKEYETRYKVTIDDTVSLNEFFETYEIVDQDGKIYIVREIKDGE